MNGIFRRFYLLLTIVSLSIPSMYAIEQPKTRQTRLGKIETDSKQALRPARSETEENEELEKLVLRMVNFVLGESDEEVLETTVMNVVDTVLEEPEDEEILQFLVYLFKKNKQDNPNTQKRLSY